jgi:hypothetical protein
VTAGVVSPEEGIKDCWVLFHTHCCFEQSRALILTGRDVNRCMLLELLEVEEGLLSEISFKIVYVTGLLGRRKGICGVDVSKVVGSIS